MDLQTRKYKIVKEVFDIEEEAVIEALENFLQLEDNTELSGDLKALLDERLEEYAKNPEDLIEWETYKKKW